MTQRASEAAFTSHNNAPPNKPCEQKSMKTSSTSHLCFHGDDALLPGRSTNAPWESNAHWKQELPWKFAFASFSVAEMLLMQHIAILKTFRCILKKKPSYRQQSELITIDISWTEVPINSILSRLSLLSMFFWLSKLEIWLQACEFGNSNFPLGQIWRIKQQFN